jgi:hypothetical protein
MYGLKLKLSEFRQEYRDSGLELANKTYSWQCAWILVTVGHCCFEADDAERSYEGSSYSIWVIVVIEDIPGNSDVVTA